MEVKTNLNVSYNAFSPNGIDGLDILEGIKKQQVPNNKMVIYPRYIASNRPKFFIKPFRVRICAGVNLLQYDVDITT